MRPARRIPGIDGARGGVPESRRVALMFLSLRDPPLQPTYRRSRMKPIATPFLSAVA
jgi:hypothetical protein